MKEQNKKNYDQRGKVRAKGTTHHIHKTEKWNRKGNQGQERKKEEASNKRSGRTRPKKWNVKKWWKRVRGGEKKGTRPNLQNGTRETINNKGGEGEEEQQQNKAW